MLLQQLYVCQGQSQPRVTSWWCPSLEGALLSACQCSITCVAPDDRLPGCGPQFHLFPAMPIFNHITSGKVCSGHRQIKSQTWRRVPWGETACHAEASGEASGSLRQRERGTVDKCLYCGFFRKVRETQNKQL